MKAIILIGLCILLIGCAKEIEDNDYKEFFFDLNIENISYVKLFERVCKEAGFNNVTDTLYEDGNAYICGSSGKYKIECDGYYYFHVLFASEANTTKNKWGENVCGKRTHYAKAYTCGECKGELK